MNRQANYYPVVQQAAGPTPRQPCQSSAQSTCSPFETTNRMELHTTAINLSNATLMASLLNGIPGGTPSPADLKDARYFLMLQ